jgi:non-heme chloroperoxidase
VRRRSDRIGHSQRTPLGAPIEDATTESLTAKIVKNAKLVVYDCAQHGFLATHEDKVNADLLAFLKS